MKYLRCQGLPGWKRFLDLAAVAVFAPGLLLLGLLVACIVKCGSPGPALFRQRRVGYRGQLFTIYKFRTMKQDAEVDSHRVHTRQLMHAAVPMTKLDARQDPRLIPLGGILRSTGLDELPQVLNILRGEMSLVGPRPCIEYEYEEYEPEQRHRLDAVPGLTGLWQVSGKNRTTFEEMVALDIKYSQNVSLWLDVSILVRTLPALWRQCQDMRGAKQSQTTPAGAVPGSINPI